MPVCVPDLYPYPCLNSLLCSPFFGHARGHEKRELFNCICAKLFGHRTWVRRKLGHAHGHEKRGWGLKWITYQAIGTDKMVLFDSD
jgi:hypothetical protein